MTAVYGGTKKVECILRCVVDQLTHLGRGGVTWVVPLLDATRTSCFILSQWRQQDNLVGMELEVRLKKGVQL